MGPAREDGIVLVSCFERGARTEFTRQRMQKRSGGLPSRSARLGVVRGMQRTRTGGSGGEGLRSSRVPALIRCAVHRPRSGGRCPQASSLREPQSSGSPVHVLPLASIISTGERLARLCSIRMRGACSVDAEWRGRFRLGWVFRRPPGPGICGSAACERANGHRAASDCTCRRVDCPATLRVYELRIPRTGKLRDRSPPRGSGA